MGLSLFCAQRSFPIVFCLGGSAAEAACQAASRPLIPLWVADMDLR